MSYSWGGWEDEFKGLTKETNFAGSANKSLGAKPDDTSGGNNNDNDEGQDATASSIFKNIAKSVVDNTDVSVEEAIDILTPEHNTDVRPSKLNTSRKHNTYFKNLEKNRATQFEFLQGFIDSDINETVFKPEGKNYSSSSIGVFTEITERRHPGQNISLRDTSSGKKVTSGGLMEVIKQNMSYDMLNKPFDYSSDTRYTPAIPTMTTIPSTNALEKGFTTFRDSLTLKPQEDPFSDPVIDFPTTLRKTFKGIRDETIEKEVSDAATGSRTNPDRTIKFTSDFDYNREEPGLSTAALGVESRIGSAGVSAYQGIANVDSALQYTLTTPTVDGFTGTTSFGDKGFSVGLAKAGDAFLDGTYNFSINADDDNNVNAALIAGWEW